MRVGPLTLHLRPRSFFQTSTRVAEALYAQAGAWVRDVGARSMLDLYCGVGGFALTAALAGAERVTGVEVSADAIAAARLSAQEAGVTADFRAGDAEAEVSSGHDLVVVNPPRRGIGILAEALEQGGPGHVIYSSCNPASLAADLRRMPRYEVAAARLFDMFPQTRHVEVAALLTRTC